MDKDAVDQVTLLHLLKEAGLPMFPLDKHGSPLPGKVLKYYRERIKYIDPESGKEKHWTQADLAKRVGVTEIMVTLMETKNQGLASIERRRVLADHSYGISIFSERKYTAMVCASRLLRLCILILRWN